MSNARIEDIGKPRVVIVGGGFAGLELAKSLKGVDVQVVLIDKQNFHTFQPLLYQVATSGIEPDAIVYPFRKIFDDQKNFYYRLAEVQRVNSEQKIIETSIGLVRYDYLVLATGAKTNFYGNEEIPKYAISIKNIDDAVALRNTVLSNFEKALQIDDDEQLNSLMDFVIVGGGPTGVELAGALSELRKHVFPKDYRELNFKEMDIHLIQSGNQLLKGMSEEASVKALEYLQKFGVKVWLNQRVKGYDGYTVTLENNEKLISRTLIWAAGVAGSPIAGIKKESIVRGDRYRVDVFNRIDGYEDIFAIGDIAAMAHKDYPEGHPMMAQPAIQQGRLLARNLEKLLKGKSLEEFQYNDKGSMATIGRNHAVADLKLFNKDVKTQGFVAWLTWMFIHLISIVGFKNRFDVFITWTISYFSYDKGIRLIMGWKKENTPVESATEKTLA